MAVSVVFQSTSAAKSVTGRTFTGVTVATNDVVILACSTSSGSASTLSDTGGNTWTQLQSPGSNWLHTWASRITNAGTWDFTQSSGVSAAHAGIILVLRGVDTSVSLALVAGVTAVSTTTVGPRADDVTASGRGSGYITIACAGLQGPTTETTTGDSDTTDGSWSTAVVDGTSGGSATTNSKVIYQYKITTGSTAQSWQGAQGSARTGRLVCFTLPAAAVATAVPRNIRTSNPATPRSYTW